MADKGHEDSETDAVPFVAVPYGGDVAVARSIAAVHVRNPWTGRCRECYPCPDRRFRLGPSPLVLDLLAGAAGGGEDEPGGVLGAAALGEGEDAGVGVGGDQDAGVAEQVLQGLEVCTGFVARDAAPWRRSCSRTGGRCVRWTRSRKRVVA